MSDPGFRIRILHQGFSPPDDDVDWIIAGSIELVIGGVTLLGPEATDIGIGKTALQLSRTLREDHAARDMDTYLVMHACGWASDGGCDNGIDWNVRHEDGMVAVSDVQEWWSTEPHVDRSDLAAVVPVDDYRAEVEAFCREALAFAEAHPRDLADDPLMEADWATWQEEVRDRLAGGTTRHTIFAGAEGVEQDPPGRLTKAMTSLVTRWRGR
ncbi:MAG: hypothetical protein KF809_15145 [Chloroflexi bacterium]|nr:hypothetical protein [Chloroflexota bacterium]